MLRGVSDKISGSDPVEALVADAELGEFLRLLRRTFGRVWPSVLKMEMLVVGLKPGTLRSSDARTPDSGR